MKLLDANVPASQLSSKAPSKESTFPTREAESSKESVPVPESAGMGAEEGTQKTANEIASGESTLDALQALQSLQVLHGVEVSEAPAVDAPDNQVDSEEHAPLPPPGDEPPVDSNPVVDDDQNPHQAGEVVDMAEGSPAEEAANHDLAEMNPVASAADVEAPAIEALAPQEQDAVQMDASDLLAESQQKEEEQKESMSQEFVKDEMQELGTELEEPSRTEPAPANSEEISASAEGVGGTDEEQSSFMSAWVAVKSFQDLCGLIEAGVSLPEQGQVIGSPLWLVDILAKDGPDPVVIRLTWLIQQSSIELPGPTSKGVDLAMALAQSIGRGPWLDFLYAHNVCQEGAVDSSSRTVESYIEDFEMINSSLGCLNLDSGADDAELAEFAREASATVQKDDVPANVQDNR